MVRVSTGLTVIPGSPDLPQFILINCSGLDPGKTVSLLIDNVRAASFRVGFTGRLKSTYRIPLRLKYKLTNFGGGQASFEKVENKNLINLKAGTQSIALKYQT